MMAPSLMWYLIGEGRKDKSFANSAHLKEVFLSKNRRVRVVEVLRVSMESKRWASDASNRQCDAPGSWYCPGQYAPHLRDLLDSKRDHNGNMEAMVYHSEFKKRSEQQKAGLPKP